MLPIFFSTCLLQRPRGNKSSNFNLNFQVENVTLSQENVPQFKEIFDSQNLYDIWVGAGNYSTRVMLNTLSTQLKKTTQSYFILCSIQLVNIKFEKSFAFGYGPIFSSGGAVFCQQSQVYIQDSQFSGNQAFYGGSICTIDSDVVSYKAKYEDDISYIQGGSMYAASIGIKTPLTTTLHIYEGYFKRCKCHEIGGAISVLNISDFYVVGVEFQFCKSGHSAGAIEISNTFASLSTCSFIANACGYQEPGTTSFATMNSRRIARTRLPRGGGAILIVTYFQLKNYHAHPSKIDTVFENCVFCNNVATLPSVNNAKQTVHNKMGLGNDIYVSKLGLARDYGGKYSLERSLSIRVNQNYNFFHSKPEKDTWNLKNLCGDSSGLQMPTLAATAELPEDHVETKIATYDIDATYTPDTIYRRTAISFRSAYKTVVQHNPTKLITYRPSHLYIQSPTPSVSQTATASTGKGTARVSIPPTKSPQGMKPPSASISFYWEPSQSKMATRTIFGQTWPDQTLTTYDGTPTASTGDATAQATSWTPSISHWGEIPHSTPSPSISFIAFPSQSSSATPTSSGATWPSQTLTANKRTPTASTAYGTAKVTSWTPSESHWGEIPNISPSATITFIDEPSQSSTASITSSGATWPSQTLTAHKRTPTASTAYDTAQLTSWTPTESHWGEIPHPSLTISVSFLAEPSQSSTASVTSSGATWPTQTITTPMGTPTASTGKGTAKLTSWTPSRSYWGEIPHPSLTISVSFLNEPSQSSTATPTSSGATWPGQTLTANKRTPTASTAYGTAKLTSWTPSESHWGEIPHPSLTISVSFLAEPSRSSYATQTSIDATWPSQTLTANKRTPTASTAYGTAKVTSWTPSESHWGEIPHPSQTASVSFMDEPSRSSHATQTSVDATWPSQTRTYYGGTPTASSGIRTAQSTSFTPSESHWGEIPHASPSESISFIADPSRSFHPTITEVDASWPTQTYIAPTPTISTGRGVPISTSWTPSSSHWGEIPNMSPSPSLSFYDQPSRSSFATRTSVGATWPTITLTPIQTSTPTASTGMGTPVKTVITKITASNWGEIPLPSPSPSWSFHDITASPKPSATSSGATWPKITYSPTISGSPTASTGMATAQSTSWTPSSSHWGEHPPTTHCSPTFLGEPSMSDLASATLVGASWPTQSPSPTLSGSPTRSPYGSKPEETSYTPSRSHWGEYPNPTPTPTMSFQFEAPYPTISPTETPTPSISSSTPTRSPIPTQTDPTEGEAFGDVTYSITLSHIDSVTFLPSYSMTYVSSLSHSFYYDEELSGYVGIYIDTDSMSYLPGSSLTYTDGYVLNYDNYFLITSVTTTVAPKLNSSLWMIIVIAGIVALIILFIIIIKIKKNKKEKSESDDSSFEFGVPEETILTVPSDYNINTCDNPLWTNLSDTDDPFRGEFEEDVDHLGFISTTF